MKQYAVLFLAALPMLGQGVDLGVVDRIKSEAFARSKVMDHLYYLTDVHGGRLTGSTEYEEAAAWAVGRLKEYGIANVHTEHWGPFGRRWSLRQASVELIAPRYANLSAVPLAWSASTAGPVTAEMVLAPQKIRFQDGPKKAREAMAAYEKQWAGKLRGKIVLISEPRVPKPQSKAQFRRLTGEELADLAKSPDPATTITAKSIDDLKWPEDPEELGKFFNGLPNNLMEDLFDLYDEVASSRGTFFAKEGVAAVLQLDERAHEGMLFAEAAGSFKSKEIGRASCRERV